MCWAESPPPCCASASLYYELTRLNVDGSASVLAGMGLTLVIRMLAAHYQWRLPKVPHP